MFDTGTYDAGISAFDAGVSADEGAAEAMTDGLPPEDAAANTQGDAG